MLALQNVTDNVIGAETAEELKSVHADAARAAEVRDQLLEGQQQLRDGQKRIEEKLP